MFQGYLMYAGAEIANNERTLAYVQRFLPRLNLQACDSCENIHNALDHPTYFDPRYDTAPWFELTDPSTENFYGLYLTQIDGMDGSSARSTVTQLLTHGAVQSSMRHEGKEVRVKGLLVAKDSDGIDAGLRYLVSRMDRTPCGFGIPCPGTSMEWYTNCPGGITSAVAYNLRKKYRRRSFRAEILDGLRIVREHPVRTGAVVEVEFTLSVGVPWSYGDFAPAVTSTGLTGSTVAEVSCAPLSTAYDDLVLDPLEPALPQPPVPPPVTVVTMPSSWTRYTAILPATTIARWGHVGVIITVTSGNSDMRMVRIRFYPDNDGLPGLDAAPCDYEGEFLVTYLPANSTLTINGVLETTEMLTPLGLKPAGHLVLGSDGRPPTWPRLACPQSYLVVIDAENGLGAGDKVLVETALGA